MSFFYYHIPKCGGTTVAELVHLNMGLSRVLSVYEKNPLLNIERVKGEIDATDYCLIKSHVPYGSISTLLTFQSFTILRNPRARLISLMRDIRHRESHYLYNAHGGHRFSPETFLNNAPPWEVDNVLVRYLIGQKGFTEIEIGQSELDEAIDNLLNQITWFGLQESFQDTMQLLANQLGLYFLVDTKCNVSKKEDPIDVSKCTRFKRYIEYDNLLYSLAEEQFKKRMSQFSYGKKSPVIKNKAIILFLKLMSRLR